MNSDEVPFRSLRELEEEVLAEGREWMRKRLEQKLQEQARCHGEVFPPQPKATVASARSSDAGAHRRRNR